ncbi:uncharacterized protein LOC111132506 [Crassostrea virginica]
MKLLVILRFLVLLTLVLQQVKSQRLVVNTTCLELAKPSNQQLRLSCGDPDQYHCLLDESNTREFEFCSDWKWIPEGDCAYFNSFGKGNIDRIECRTLENMICSQKQYPSYENTKYTACYVKENTETDRPMKTTRSSRTIPYETVENSTGNTLSSTSTSSDNIPVSYWRMIIACILGVLVPILTICGVYFVLNFSKCLHHSREQKDGLPDEERPMENHALLINTSDVETGNAVRGTEEANNTVPNTREENSKDEEHVGHESVELLDSTPERLQREVTPEIDDESEEVFDATIESLTREIPPDIYSVEAA